MKLIDKVVHMLDPEIECNEIPCIEPGSNQPENASSQPAGEGTQVQDVTVQTPADLQKASDQKNDKKLKRMGLNTALAIAIHNFPEGLATFVATVDDPAVGATLAIAIAIHNIPEGLCVSVPVFYSTGHRRKAFGWGVLSGISEPIGALLGWVILMNAMTDAVYGILFGIVAGMMVAIVLHELLPTAHRYDPKDVWVTNSVIAGMMIMSASLVMFLY